jgi:hypothetical protein
MANRLTVIIPATLCNCALNRVRDTQPVNTGSRNLREEKDFSFTVNTLYVNKKTFTNLLFRHGCTICYGPTKVDMLKI